MKRATSQDAGSGAAEGTRHFFLYAAGAFFALAALGVHQVLSYVGVAVVILVGEVASARRGARNSVDDRLSPVAQWLVAVVLATAFVVVLLVRDY
jgi:NADH:ubiquinone oxidoreductase subunit 6 (subunit J)